MTQPTPEDLRAEIRKCRDLLDDPELPFGVNVTLLPALVPTDPEPILRVIIEEGVKVVETAGRSPEALIPPLHEAGITIVHKCVAVRHAVTAERLGCDAISMDGFECGGHPGEEDIGNFVLQAIAARNLKVPYVCSVSPPSTPGSCAPSPLHCSLACLLQLSLRGWLRLGRRGRRQAARRRAGARV